MKQQLDQLKTNIESHATGTRKTLLLALVAALEPRLLEAPASSAARYHHAFAGGLIQHVNEVFCAGEYLTGNYHTPGNHLQYEGEFLIPKVSGQSLITVALLHDLAKIGDGTGKPYYIPNISEKTGKRSEAEPFKVSKEVRKFETGMNEADFLLEFGDFSDGEASLAFVKAKFPTLYADLTESEINAVRYHDGGYGKAKHAAGFKGKEDALVILIHAADMLSSRKRNWNQE